MENKIYIIGPVGSGKTTLAKKLSKKYNIKHYELDKIVWNDEIHKKRTKEEIKKLFQEIIKNKSWIIEDIGRKIFYEGIKKADIVYYIDLPKIKVYKRCILRWIKQKLNKETSNYSQNIKTLFENLKWTHQDLKNKNEKLNYIKENAKKIKIIN